MAEYQSEFGELKVFEDFLGVDPDATFAVGGFDIGGVSVTSVNEGSVETTVDESGGVIAITTDTADNDNAALYVGVFQPSKGPIVMEARVKMASATTSSLFIGFCETLAKDTPVMPAEFATTTMTHNPGGHVGLQWDIDATTDDWRAAFGDASAASGSNDATRANSALAADTWDVVRAEIDPNGVGRVYLNGKLVASSVTAAVNPSDLFHAVVFTENRSGAANVMEVDYFYAKGFRDWNND